MTDKEKKFQAGKYLPKEIEPANKPQYFDISKMIKDAGCGMRDAGEEG